MYILGLLGFLIYLIAWIWLIVVGFKVGGVLWAIVNVPAQPVTGLIFCIVKKTGWLQLTAMIVGAVFAVIGFLPAVLNFIERVKQ
jgi:hypothetical protein